MPLMKGVEFPTKDITVVLNDKATTFYFAYYEGQYIYTNDAPLFDVMEYDDELSMNEALLDGTIFVIYDPTEIKENVYVTTTNKKNVLKFEVTKEKLDLTGICVAEHGTLESGAEYYYGANIDIDFTKYNVDIKSDLKVFVNGREKTLILCGTSEGATLWTEAGKATAGTEQQTRHRCS